ncbi:MAG TPA: DUF305 domain-containing protein [Candidatus Paceibacterota bacterium]|jgi:uncharacterized protein (DUF305 family)|nr:DUF305 domain-containing protein [Candidatus Paceibacterota bacterium]
MIRYYYSLIINKNMSKISTTLAISLMIITGIIGVVIGYSITPDYQAGMYDKTAMDFGRPDRTLDLRYINTMIAHHRGAMLLAEQVSIQTQRQEMKDLSAMILKDEPPAIDELYAWKKQWYGDTKKVKDPIVANLGNYDEKFDLRFLNALIAHHEMGLVMTDEIKTKSSRTEILNNADAVDTFLTTTLKLFKDWRVQWYNI